MADVLSDDVAIIEDIGSVPPILDSICRMTGMGFAAVARVTADRWVACAVQDNIGFGLKPGSELPVDTTLCRDVRASQQAIVIDDVSADPAYASHHTPRLYGLQSYISVPIQLKDGTLFGTLCAIDPQPRRLHESDAPRIFALYAELIAFHIDARRSLTAVQADLAEERKTALLRDQFIGVLGHDLRNPLASIHSGARLLARADLDARGQGILTLIQASILRMNGLIDNMLDYARNALGDGIGPLQMEMVSPAPLLAQIVAEQRLAQPQRTIRVTGDTALALPADKIRLGQIMSNLIDNAITHGLPDGAVDIEMSAAEGAFLLCVHNPAHPLPDTLKQRLFKPFARAQGDGPKGLGLGLHISREIAEAHGGTLEFQQDGAIVSFRLSLPLVS